MTYRNTPERQASAAKKLADQNDRTRPYEIQGAQEKQDAEMTEARAKAAAARRNRKPLR